jgi:hypothetical protein
MFYRCKKVQLKPINIEDRVQIQRSKKLECAVVWRTGLSMCHQTMSGALGPYRIEHATLGFLQARSAIIHRIVRCTSGVTTPSRNGRLQKLKIQMNSEEQCAQSHSRPSEAHRTVNSTCPV